MTSHYIENEQAYENATKRAIIWNARKTFCRTSAKQQFLNEVLTGNGYPLENTGEDEGAYRMSHPMHKLPAFVHKLPAFVQKMVESFDKYGKLSAKQVEACFESMAARQNRIAEFKQANQEKIDKQRAASAYVGQEGDKLSLDLTCEHIMEVQGYSFSHYDSGISYWFIMADDSGNQFRYKGRADFIKKGQKATVSCKVKRHYIDNKGIACTVISHPKTTFVYL
jgi:hypothetical protein